MELSILGAAIGAGLAAIGVGIGIGIQAVMLIAAALIEGVGLFALVICILALFTK